MVEVYEENEMEVAWSKIREGDLAFGARLGKVILSLSGGDPIFLKRSCV